jgi:hypothetical protein
MSNLENRIDIKAPPHQVWAVLTDFASYPDWNPFVRELRGEAVEGRSLSVRIRSSTGNERQFWARIVKSEAPDLLRWQDDIVGAGLLRCQHSFALTPRTDGGTTVAQMLSFSGPLAALVRGRFAREVGTGVEAMGKALRARVEGKD